MPAVARDFEPLASDLSTDYIAHRMMVTYPAVAGRDAKEKRCNYCTALAELLTRTDQHESCQIQLLDFIKVFSQLDAKGGN